MQLHSKASLPVSFMYTYSYVTHPLHVTERGSANDTNNLHFTTMFTFATTGDGCGILKN